MQFLALPHDSLEDHVKYTAWAYGRYARKLTRYERDYELLKIKLEETRNKLIKEVCSRVNPQTNQPYSVTHAEKLVTDHSVLAELRRSVVRLKYKAQDMKRYLRALEIKANCFPGSQGLRNRSGDLEEQYERGES